MNRHDRDLEVERSRARHPSRRREPDDVEALAVQLSSETNTLGVRGERKFLINLVDGSVQYGYRDELLEYVEKVRAGEVDVPRRNPVTGRHSSGVGKDTPFWMGTFVQAASMLEGIAELREGYDAHLRLSFPIRDAIRRNLIDLMSE